ncbi:DUF6176 family protein [Peptoniphilus mikwangii]|uniref:DUF6176 family protein n=1 Tax=Peptoniphilus mikwangii TaxID=1354300 RepID=UPI00056091C9|nr:DUF6176 family protein [Peptoniphilus mikwangii]
MKIELSRFRVRDGKSEVVDMWMNFLNEYMEDVLLTLDREKMYVETIFREKSDNAEYLYWYSIQGENGINVEDSNSWIDKKHLEYWDECIDKNYHVDMSMQVSMIPHHIAKLMTDNTKA